MKGLTVAQRVNVTLVDDLDGGEAEETVRFGLDGTEYEIDLSSAHAGNLRAAYADYIAKARRIRRIRATATARLEQPGSQERNAAIREWATRNGIPIGDRGRIASDVIKAYNAAQRSRRDCPVPPGTPHTAVLEPEPLLAVGAG